MSITPVNTFRKYSEQNKVFINQLILENYDYIVPVERKGCKLLRVFQLDHNEVSTQIRYRQFFENTKPDLNNKRVAIIDDASKYTSTLYDYRMYFESLGARVDTFSFVGQIMLATKERKQYDEKAVVRKYLAESTYQEYIIQQSIELSNADNFYDIDHVLFRLQINPTQYEQLFKEIINLGLIDFTNDVYTPEYITKFCLYDFTFPVHIPFSENSGVIEGAIKKIRFSYNKRTQMLSIVPLNLISWDTTSDDSVIQNIKQIPFIPPFETNENIEENGIYMDVMYICCMYLMRDFIQQTKDIIDPRALTIEKYDLISYVGDLDRVKQIEETAIHFLAECDDYEKIRTCKNVFTAKESCPDFGSVLEIMNYLRESYNSLVDKAYSILDVRFFLSYDTIFTHYKGHASLMKWIDMLCDRGVMVARNRKLNGVFTRVCRSGEGDFNHSEEKTELLLPFIISMCGQKDDNGKNYIIQATYLNKILANLAFDYPNHIYDFHRFYTKPHMYGPLTYTKSTLNEELEDPIYHAAAISKYCVYDERRKVFVCTDPDQFLHQMENSFSSTDEVPMSDIINYVRGLIQIKQDAKKADILNELVLCRNSDFYYAHLHYDISLAFLNISRAMHCPAITFAEKTIRDAAKVANEAEKKIKYNQDRVFERVESSLKGKGEFFPVYKTITSSKVSFPKEFVDKTLSDALLVTLLEQMIINLMLFSYTRELKYCEKFLRRLNEIQIDELCEARRIVDKTVSEHELEGENAIFYLPCGEISNIIYTELSKRFNTLQKPVKNADLQIRLMQNYDTAINRCAQFIKRERLQEYTLLHIDYTGFRNLDGQRAINIPQKIQETIRKQLPDEKLSEFVFGESGDTSQGMCIFAQTADAVRFAKKLMQALRDAHINQVQIRFGCSRRNTSLQSSTYDSIKEAWADASRLTNSHHLNAVFVISANTYNQLPEAEKRQFIMREALFQNNVLEKCYMELHLGTLNSQSVIVSEDSCDESVRIGIITVLPEEFNAMMHMLKRPMTWIFKGKNDRYRRHSAQFCVGQIEMIDGSDERIVLARTIGPGNEAAATRVKVLKEYYPNLEVIIMTGIAGGVPSSEDGKYPGVVLGDIVTAKGIVDYDFIKDNGEIQELRGKEAAPNPRLVEAEHRLENMEFDHCRPWEIYIDDFVAQYPDFARPNDDDSEVNDGKKEKSEDVNEENKKPHVFREKIASANRVLKDPNKRDQLRRQYGVYAIEMEASGIKHATWEEEIGYYVVRGISDYCDGMKNDVWHNYASIVAAAYTRSLIENMLS